METKGRVLVVDDDRAIRKLLERIARRAGFEVDSATDGVVALEMIDRQHYDVAVIDLMMPRLSGYELVQHIGTRERRPVVIVATALASSDVASVDDTLVRQVIRKPFDVHAVVAALHAAAAATAPKPAEGDKPSDGEAPPADAAAPSC